jgi:hypothetical protein
MLGRQVDRGAYAHAVMSRIVRYPAADTKGNRNECAYGFLDPFLHRLYRRIASLC